MPAPQYLLPWRQTDDYHLFCREHGLTDADIDEDLEFWQIEFECWRHDYSRAYELVAHEDEAHTKYWAAETAE